MRPLALPLLALTLSSCLASQDYVEDRVDAMNEARIDTAAAIVEPFEEWVPGITSYARDRARGVTVRAPAPSERMPWELIIGGAVTLLTGVPMSVGITNRMRDQRRHRLNEATNVSEAVERGYYDGTKSAPPHETEGSQQA